MKKIIMLFILLGLFFSLISINTVSADDTWDITYDDIVGHWHLNETTGTDVNDASPHNNDGVTQNMENEDWVTGKLNNCLVFDGTDEYVDCGNIAGFERTDAFSGDVWVYKSISTQFSSIFNKMHSSWTGWVFGVNGLKLSLMLRKSSSYIQVSSTELIPLNTWTHIAFSYNGSSDANGVKFWINAYPSATTILQNTLGTNSILNSIPFKLCAGLSGGLAYWNGKVDELVIYNKELSQSEVDFRYNDGDGREIIDFGNPPNKPICIQPVDKTMNTNIDTTLKTRVIDIDNDFMNVSFYLDNILFENFTNVANNTIVESSNLSLEYSELYRWHVVAQDEKYSVDSDTFIFATISEPEPVIPNIPPEKPILISPDNNSISITEFTRLKTHVNDFDDDFLYVSFYWENNSEIQSLFSITNYTIQTSTLNLDYNTTYSWYVVVTDFIDFNVSDVYTFTTEIEPEDEVEDDVLIPPVVELDYTVLLIGICLAVIVFILEFYSNRLIIKKTKLLSAIELALMLIIISIMIFLKFS